MDGPTQPQPAQPDAQLGDHAAAHTLPEEMRAHNGAVARRHGEVCGALGLPVHPKYSAYVYRPKCLLYRDADWGGAAPSEACEPIRLRLPPEVHEGWGRIGSGLVWADSKRGGLAVCGCAGAQALRGHTGTHVWSWHGLDCAEVSVD